MLNNDAKKHRQCKLKVKWQLSYYIIIMKFRLIAEVSIPIGWVFVVGKRILEVLIIVSPERNF